jgi:hypothetical protein
MIVRLWAAESNRYKRESEKCPNEMLHNWREREMNDNAANSWRRECPSSDGVS